MGADSKDVRARLRTLLDKARGTSNRPGPVTRRDFLQLGAVAGAGASLSGTRVAAGGRPVRRVARAGRVAGAGRVQRGDHRAAPVGDGQGAHERGRADQLLSQTDSGDRREGTAPELRDRAQPRRARDCPLTLTRCGGRAACSDRSMAFPSSSRTTSTPATGCRPPPVRSRWRAGRRPAMPPWPPSCARAVRSSSEKRT